MASSIPIKYELLSNRSIWILDTTQTGTTTPYQSGTGINGNE